MSELSEADRQVLARMMRDAFMRQETSDGNWKACQHLYLVDWDMFKRSAEAAGYAVVKK